MTLGFRVALAVSATEPVLRTTASLPALGLPMRWVYLAMVAGALGMGVAAAGLAWRTLRAGRA